MISVLEPFVTVRGERFYLFTHQTLSSGCSQPQIFTPLLLFSGRLGQTKGRNLCEEQKSENGSFVRESQDSLELILKIASRLSDQNNSMACKEVKV